MQVLVAIRKDILSQVIVKHQIDLVSHFYYIVLDIKKFQAESRKYPRKTKIVNLYNNKVGKK